MRTVLVRVQNDLFDVGADLATPVVEDPKYPPLRVEQCYVDKLEADCDRFLEDLEKLRSFILPGGTPGAALLHQACTVVRRAERSTWAALEEHGETMNPLTATYLNRLSDLLFILARTANKAVRRRAVGAGGRTVNAGPTALLIDLGGVLVADKLPAAAAKWAARLHISERDFVTAVYEGNDEQILIGRMSNAEWWALVGERLGLDEAGVAEVRADLAAHPEWDEELLAAVTGLRGRVRTAFVSNAWPDARPNLADRLGAADEAVLSCEVGFAKPDPRIYTHTLELLGASAAASLFVDDVPANVEAARELGMTGHVHTDSAETRAVLDAFAATLPGGH